MTFVPVAAGLTPLATTAAAVVAVVAVELEDGVEERTGGGSWGRAGKSASPFGRPPVFEGLKGEEPCPCLFPNPPKAAATLGATGGVERLSLGDGCGRGRITSEGG